jgi:hypothetical protein
VTVSVGTTIKIKKACQYYSTTKLTAPPIPDRRYTTGKYQGEGASLALVIQGSHTPPGAGAVL